MKAEQIRLLTEWYDRKGNTGLVVARDVNRNTVTIQFTNPLTKGEWSEIFQDHGDISDYNKVTREYRKWFPQIHLFIPTYEDVVADNEWLYAMTKNVVPYNEDDYQESSELYVWLGSPDGAYSAYGVDSGGVDNYGSRNNSYAVAPAFTISADLLQWGIDGNDGEIENITSKFLTLRNDRTEILKDFYIKDIQSDTTETEDNLKTFSLEDLAAIVDFLKIRGTNIKMEGDLYYDNPDY